jgi:hypothetical protein
LKKVGPDQHNLASGVVQKDPSQAYNSKTFLVRYCEEKVEINEIVLFRAEVDVQPGYLDTEFSLDVELLFSDL